MPEYFFLTKITLRHGYVALSSVLFARMVERFTEALSDPDDGREAAEALRSLIGEIVLPSSDRKRDEVHAELSSELMGILAFATEKNARFIGIMSPAAS